MELAHSFKGWVCDHHGRKQAGRHGAGALAESLHPEEERHWAWLGFLKSTKPHFLALP